MSTCDVCGREVDESLLEDFTLYTTYKKYMGKVDTGFIKRTIVTNFKYIGPQKHEYFIGPSCKRRGSWIGKLYFIVPLLFGIPAFILQLLFDPAFDPASGMDWFGYSMLSFCVVPLLAILPSFLVLRLFKPEVILKRRAKKAHILGIDPDEKRDKDDVRQDDILVETALEYGARTKTKPI